MSASLKKLVLLGTAVALVACATAAQADPLGDATAGLGAMDRGDNATAIRLFTQTLNSGALAPADRELAKTWTAGCFYVTSGANLFKEGWGTGATEAEASGRRRRAAAIRSNG